MATGTTVKAAVERMFEATRLANAGREARERGNTVEQARLFREAAALYRAARMPILAKRYERAAAGK